MELTQAVLLKMDDNHMVTINGENYIVLDFDFLQSWFSPSEKKIPQNKTNKLEPIEFTDEIKTKVLEILKDHPYSPNKSIRSYMTLEYKLKMEPTTMSALLGRMKSEGTISVMGTRGNAAWFVPKD